MLELDENEKCKIKSQLEAINDYIGTITWISTVVVAVLTVTLKFLWYVYECGKLRFLKIDNSAISVIGENILYDIVVSLFFGVILVVIMSIPAIIITSNQKKYMKGVEILGLFVIFSIILFLLTKAWLNIGENFKIGIVVFLIFCMISFFVFFCQVEFLS